MWFAMVTVPLVRADCRMEMYWVKVEVPSIEGSLVRVFFQIVYVPPSLVKVPICVPPVEMPLLVSMT
jgi:hypothetical protein